MPLSRALERSCINDPACPYLAAYQAPDLRSIARFCRRYLKLLEGLFTRVLAGRQSRAGAVGSSGL